MKLPQVYADVNVSADSPHRGIPAAAFQSGLGAAGKELASGLEDVGKDLARQANKKQVLDEQAEAIYLQSQAELALQQSTAVRKQTETDGNTYLEDTRKDFQDVMERVAGQAKNPGTARLLRNHMAGRLVTLDGQALNHAADLTKRADVAQLTTTIDNYRQQLHETDVDDGQNITRIQGLIESAIQVRAASLGVDEAAKLAIAERKKTTEEIAYRDATTAPGVFLSRVDRYRGMDGKVLDQLVTSANARIETLTRLQQVAEDKAERKAEVASEKQRQVDLTFLSDLAAEKELTPQHVVEARDSGLIVNRTEFDDYMKMATKQNSADSDQALWSSVQADVWGEKPTYTEGRIRALMGRHSEGGVGLKGDDGRQALAELARKREAAEAKGKAAAGESRTIANEQHARARESYQLAKDEGLTLLGIVTPMSMYDKKQAKLVSLYTRELNALVLDTNGNVKRPARPAMLEILPKYEAMQDAESRLTFKEQSDVYRESTGSPVPDISNEKFSEWYDQQKTAALALQKDPKTMGLYTLRRDQLLSLKRAQQEYLESQARRAETKKKSTGGYTPPPSRKP